MVARVFSIPSCVASQCRALAEELMKLSIIMVRYSVSQVSSLCSICGVLGISPGLTSLSSVSDMSDSYRSESSTSSISRPSVSPLATFCRLSVRIESFIVTVIGGMGSILGAILTGYLLGIAEGLTKVFYPEASNIVIFVIMAIVLILRPAGLFGKEG